MSVAYDDPEWRYGPLHCTDGQIYIGDPLSSCVHVFAGGLSLKVSGETQMTIPWALVEEIRLSLPSTRSYVASRFLTIAAALMTALTSQVDAFDSHEPGEMQVDTSESFMSWQIDSMETGNYWLPHVERTQRLLETMQGDPEFRKIVESPSDLRRWVTSVPA